MATYYNVVGEKLPNLANLSNPNVSDQIFIWDDSAQKGKRISLNALATYIGNIPLPPPTDPGFVPVGGYTGGIQPFETTNNTLTSQFSSILGGDNHVINNSSYSSVGGGKGNSIQDNKDSFIGSGRGNIIQGGNPFGINSILSGYYNALTQNISSTIISGTYHISQNSYFSFIGNGNNNYILTGSQCSILNGVNNEIENAQDGTILSGNGNRIYNCSFSSILGGYQNDVTHNKSFVLGDNITTTADRHTWVNNLAVTYGAVVGHVLTCANADGRVTWQAPGGGGAFTYSAIHRIVTANTALNAVSTRGCSILGGENNQITVAAIYSSIAGGYGNVINEPYSFIGGGLYNTVNHRRAFILGDNIASVRENALHAEQVVIKGGGSNYGSLNLPILALDPAAPVDGDIWVFESGATYELRIKFSTGIKAVALA